MNLWSHRFSQNTNETLSGSLPCVKVSKSWKQIMMSLILPKNKRNTPRIVSLVSFIRFLEESGTSKFAFEIYWPLLRAEILTMFCSYFGRNNDSINSFWNELTFTVKNCANSNEVSAFWTENKWTSWRFALLFYVPVHNGVNYSIKSQFCL